MNMTKGALILSLSFLLAACSSIPQNIKGNNQPDIQKSFVAVHNQPGLYVGQQARFGGKVDWPPESPDNQYHLNK